MRPLLGSYSIIKSLQNHDNNVNITHVLELERELQVAPLSYTRAAPPGVGGPGGPATYWVPVSVPPQRTLCVNIYVHLDIQLTFW